MDLMAIIHMINDPETLNTLLTISSNTVNPNIQNPDPLLPSNDNSDIKAAVDNSVHGIVANLPQSVNLVE